MKKIISYLFCLAVFCSSTAQALEEENVLSYKYIQEIVKKALPEAFYKASEDLNETDKEKFKKASSFTRTNPILIPLEVFSNYIFPYLDSQTFVRVRLTCHSFYELTDMSVFYLNEYCLTETRPQQIPVHLLNLKTNNTKNGIFNLASLMSVLPEDLLKWFTSDYLITIFLRCNHDLPENLESLSEEQMSKLYAVLKIGLASSQIIIEDLLTPIENLFNKLPNYYSLTLNSLRLKSLNKNLYYQALEEIINGYNLHKFSCSSQLIDYIARVLLLTGENPLMYMAWVNSNVFVYNPQRKENAIEIIKWCIHNHSFCNNSDYVILCKDALYLEYYELALKAFNKLDEVPVRSNYDRINHKVALASEIIKDQKIKNTDLEASLKEFAKDIYSCWSDIPPVNWLNAISLLMWVERKGDVQKAIDHVLLDHQEGVLNVCPNCLFKILSENNYFTEADKLRLFCATWKIPLDVCNHS